MTRRRRPWWVRVALIVDVVAVAALFLVAIASCVWGHGDGGDALNGFGGAAVDPEWKRTSYRALRLICLGGTLLVGAGFGACWLRLGPWAVAGGAAGAVMCLAGGAVEWEARGQRQQHRRSLGQCARCEYNLTGNVSGTCPECGCPVAASPAAAVGGPASRGPPQGVVRCPPSRFGP